MDKVIGGTPIGTRSMCDTCRAAHRVIGLNRQEVVMCRQTNPMLRITFPVSECSVYDDKRTPSLYQMEQIAWNVTARNRKPTGFAQEATTEIHIEPPDPRSPNSTPPPVTG